MKVVVIIEMEASEDLCMARLVDDVDNEMRCVITKSVWCNQPIVVQKIHIAPVDILHSWTPEDGVVSKIEAIERESPPRT